MKSRAAAFLFCAALVMLCASCDTAGIRAAIVPHSSADDGATNGSGGDSVNSASGNSFILTEQAPYDENTAVAINTASDVYTDADITSVRMTQLRFNEPVRVLAYDNQWANVELSDGTQGYVKTENIDGDWACVDKRRYTNRIVITNREKQIYSLPRNGVLIRDVGMGTELFVISKSDNVYQVALPGNLTGWISENGVFELSAEEPITKTTAELFVTSCKNFMNISYLHGGMSFQGIDGAGLIHVAAGINGVFLPRDYAGQFASGEYVSHSIDTSVLQTGDTLFFSPNGESADVADAGVYTEEGQFLHVSPHTGRVQLENVNDPFFIQRILGVRRYFK